ncbi:ATP-binding response regulator [Entomobacter blattae]|uniref:histidine kinase n=1 Tax=Entomobacter blattae TaxID=2762277 RepID=A0A7H1NUX8_9PROT|nr:ATP-binding protein [Entomobacter blattae]QNT79588.1 Sensor histidine kinase RcsC [Entomobacter blattae]
MLKFSLIAPKTPKPVVLLVDDEPEILLALTDLLEDEFEIVATGNPFEALEIVKTNTTISVIISDQRMPGMNGDQFLTRARQFTSAPAIFLTGYADMEAVITALNQGRIMFFSHKPWEESMLLSMVRQAVGHFQMGQDLAVERVLMQGLLDNITEGLAFKDKRGCFIRLNEQAAQSFGLAAEECLGLTEEECQQKNRAALKRRVTYRVEHTDRIEEMVELSDASSDKALKWLHVLRINLSTMFKAGSFSVVIEHDVTEFRKLEIQLQQAEKMLALGTMAGGIAHDFNNILASLMGSLEMMEQLSCVHEEQGRILLKNAFSAAQKGSKLTQRLLSFSRQQEINLQNLDIVETLSRLHTLLEQAIMKRIEDRNKKTGTSAQVRLIYHLPQEGQGPYRAFTDQEQLEMALMNLCLNAVDAMPVGGEITLAVEKYTVQPNEQGQELLAGQYIMVSVTDTGMGMSEEVKSRIFEPFFTTKHGGDGTGLGLAIVYSFLKQQGGNISIKSEVGKGSCFQLFLPVTQNIREKFL